MSALRDHGLQILLVLAVFFAFLLNAAGIIDVTLVDLPRIAVHPPLGPRLFGEGPVPHHWLSRDFAVFITIGLLLSFLLPLLKPIHASLLVLLLMCVPLYLAYAAPERPLAIPMEYTLLTILILFMVNVLASYYNLTHARARLIRIFGQYIPPTVVEAMVRHPDTFTLEGEAHELSVMFCDIRDFSAISEALDPRQLAKMLNAYFTSMTDILHRHGATIDKYIGDAIMAFWGAPLPQPDHARRALSAALEMQAALVDLNRRFAEKGWPAIQTGIGISTGIMNVGNMGSRYRVSYTVVGDAVNVGARLESLTRVYDAPIIVSEATRNAIPEVLFRELDIVRVKGKGEPTRIFEPVGLLRTASPADHESVALHHEALTAYYARDWEAARAAFDRLLASNGRRRYCELFLSRIAEFMHTPPPPEWDGATRVQVEERF